MNNELYRGTYCKEVHPGIYMITMPMEGMGTVNAFLIRGKDGVGTGKHLIVDAGCNTEEDGEVMLGALDELGITLDEVEFFITHLHVDHLCGLTRYWKPGMRVYAHFASAFDEQLDCWMRMYTFVPGFRNSFKKYPSVQRTGHEMWRLSTDLLPIDPEFTVLNEGDVLEVGDYHLEVMETPGHEQFELCLWEPSEGIMFTGDIIMTEYCTNPYLRDFSTDEMADLIESYHRIEAMPVKLALSGHGEPLYECQAMCRRNLAHHAKRVDAIYEIVASSKASHLADIVVAMTNSGNRTPWEERDDGNRWDTYMENATFLNHLVHIGKLRMEEREPFEFYFFPVEDADASAQDATPATAIPASDEPAR